MMHVRRYSFGEEERSERDNLKRAAFSGDVDMGGAPIPGPRARPEWSDTAARPPAVTPLCAGSCNRPHRP